MDAAAEVVEGYWERVRRFELEAVKALFRPGLRVLELGAGSGFQASLIASWGCEVEALDVSLEERPERVYFPAQTYDGMNIPFPSGAFDLLFSSNVLEHVQHPLELLTETRRVLKPGALAVHILPSTAWRFWTSLLHYVWVVKYALQRGHGDAVTAREVVKAKGLWQTVRFVLSPGPHGAYPNVVSELWYYSRRRWLSVFRAAGFAVTQVRPTHLFYTAYGIVPAMPFRLRKVLAHVLGSACSIFVMHPEVTRE